MGKVTVTVEAANISSEEISKQVKAILHYLEMAKPVEVVDTQEV